jgi:hypothetical protein
MLVLVGAGFIARAGVSGARVSEIAMTIANNARSLTKIRIPPRPSLKDMVRCQ